ncbi:MAG: nucleotidyl transferase AbiEii/AbiGii toxin family protein [Phycisphaerae bacterium]|nr:nucleotidyl transferase AbiEii/AbiGii toxin family protein [Phycisphaerae bacterium]
MSEFTGRQYVEMFHLLFLAQLGRKVDKRFYALKGGCNLRFFLKSPRYSEDMDLDAREMPVHLLKDKVNGILRSTPFAQILQARGISIEHVNDDKQTQTTQRWKLGLVVPRIERPLPTKIEFSRRDMAAGAKFEPIDPAVIAAYGLQPLMTNHYPKELAYRQKVQALVDRKQVQARDVFDLHLLLAAGVSPGDLPQKLRSKTRAARDNLMTVDFDVFAGQVLAYLAPEDQALYDEETWDTMRLRVLAALEEAEK